ncbi:MAG: hypothetical protein D6791_17125 [Chloroflexi bacterium]|nr:MAG: hypothetical protein D6791_17125 [Chloroflexota bacterium]
MAGHLRKKCYEMSSMICRGKQAKARLLGRLYRHLWRGDVEGAIQVAKFLAQDAQIALAPGYWFGREGAGFARMTIGCPRDTIRRALDNLTLAAKKL